MLGFSNMQESDKITGVNTMEKQIHNRAFIDGQNLRLGTISAKPAWVIDLKRFRVFLAERYKAQQVYYFVGAYDAKNCDLYDALRSYGYIVVFREHASASLSHKKGNVDTDIVFEVMRELVDKEDFDKVILVSGDGDYWRMVDYLIKKDKFAKLLVPNTAKLSSLYKKRMADIYRVYLDEDAIKKKIIYKQKRA